MNAKRRPTDAQLAEMLNQPHFARRRSETEAPSHDPITRTPMIVAIDEIDYYDHNPRQVPNPKYPEIKTSIAAGDMDQALVITRRPGAPRYMIYKGGNTRLRALKELYAETGDERFQKVHCEFQPWTGRESDGLLGHMKENDIRGDLVFIDRALGIRRLKLMLEEETGEPLSSQRRLSALLKERGYSISYKLIQWFDYAADVLHPVIPNALFAGMGRPQIERIRALDRAFARAWEMAGLVGKFFDADNPDEMARSVFQEVLSRQDGEQIDLDTLRRQLETELSVTADIDVQRASLLMGAALDGRTLAEGPRQTQPDHPDPDEGGEEAVDGDRPEADLEQDPLVDPAPPMTQAARSGPEQRLTSPPEDAPPAGNTKRSDEPSHVAPPQRQAEERATRSPAVSAESVAASTASAQLSETATASDLPHLRERAADLARQITTLARLGDLVRPIPFGAGFLLEPVPDEILTPFTDAQVTHFIHLWWLLAQISEQFAAGSGAEEYMPDEWRDRPIGEAVRQGRAGGMKLTAWLFNNKSPEVWGEVPFAPLPGFGPSGWPQMHDWAWEAFVELVGIYRAIHKVTKGKIWG